MLKKTFYHGTFQGNGINIIKEGLKGYYTEIGCGAYAVGDVLTALMFSDDYATVIEIHIPLRELNKFDIIKENIFGGSYLFRCSKEGEIVVPIKYLKLSYYPEELETLKRRRQ